MKRVLKTVAGTVVVAAILGFIAYSFYALANPPGAAPGVSLADAPVRVYGVVEPAGGAVVLSPAQPRRVAVLFVEEGEAVEGGQAVLSFEGSVETAQLGVARARIDVLRKTVSLSADELARTEALFASGVVTEYEHASARLRHEVNEASLVAAEREADLAQAVLDDLTLRSPVDGIVYRLDVRVGETIGPEDRTRVLLGRSELHVRLFVEAFWIGRVRPGAEFDVFDVETDLPVGTGRVLSLSRVLGAKRIRVEDRLERQDTQYQETVLALEPKEDAVPIGLPVYATFEE
jgi:multidrug efflux pump subunit AcrA (membrane-fusion protein)